MRRLHFQGYIVNIKELTIIHINSICWGHPKNPRSLQIPNVFVLINLPEFSDRYNAFDIAYNLLERNPIMQKVESLSPQFSTEDQMKKIASADFLIHVLTNDPERSEYFRQSPPKGIRTNFFFITDISKTPISDINADDNGAYLKSRNTNKFYYCEND